MGMDTAGWIGFLSGYAVLIGYAYNKNAIQSLSQRINFFEETKLYWPVSVLFTVGSFIYFFLLSLRNGISDETTGWLYVFITGASLWPWTLKRGGEFSAILLTAVGSVGLLITCDSSVRGALCVIVAHHVGMDLFMYGIFIRRFLSPSYFDNMPLNDNDFVLPEHRYTLSQRIVFELYVLYFGPLSGAWVWTDASGIIIVTVTGLHFVVGFFSTISNPIDAFIERYTFCINIVSDILIATGHFILHYPFKLMYFNFLTLTLNLTQKD